MSRLDRLLVSAAVAASPHAQREASSGSPTSAMPANSISRRPRLAFGALTTALFHRRADRRSTWGNTMTTMPGTVRRAPHTIPTIQVLVTFAVLSFLAGSVGLGLLQRYNGFAGSIPVAQLVTLALTIVPGIAIGASVLLVAGVPLRRRAIGAVVVLAVSALWWSVVTGFFSPPVWPALSLGVIASAWLAVWLVVLRRPGWTWSLLLLPIAASALVFPLANGVFGTQLAYSVQAAAATALEVVPFLVALVAAVIAKRLDQRAPRNGVEVSGASVDVTS